jgi:deoxyribodipyrimidine photo-lyase
VKPIIVWHRRDLRVADNTALNEAIKSAAPILPVFILADDILKERDDFSPLCVKFMTESLRDLDASYQSLGGKLIVRRGRFLEVMRSFVKEADAAAIYFNEDYEPAAKERDALITREFSKAGLEVRAFKDQVCFAKEEVLTKTAKPYTVFTPYKRAWLSLSEKISKPVAPPKRLSTPSISGIAIPTHEALGFKTTAVPLVTGGEREGKKCLAAFAEKRILRYKDDRDFPATDGTSLLSAHLRFGTVSARTVYAAAVAAFDEAKKENETISVETFISELIWRDFYFQILENFPVVERDSFQPSFRKLTWENREDYFEKWKTGTTGFPIVDAAMRQLNQTGWMHNRLRMIVASFLTKDLLIDWRWGEKYFMQTLIDGDMAANNGGWQWSASTGTDAQPYFRIFNPASQSEKFDPKGTFIKQFVPELNAVPEKYIHTPVELLKKSPLLEKELGITLGKQYPLPMIDHSTQREKALKMYKESRMQ